MISRTGQSLTEQSEMSVVEILNLSAKEMLKSFCGSCPMQETEQSILFTSHEEPAIENLETTVNRNFFYIIK